MFSLQILLHLIVCMCMYVYVCVCIMYVYACMCIPCSNLKKMSKCDVYVCLYVVLNACMLIICACILMYASLITLIAVLLCTFRGPVALSAHHLMSAGKDGSI